MTAHGRRERGYQRVTPRSKASRARATARLTGVLMFVQRTVLVMLAGFVCIGVYSMGKDFLADFLNRPVKQVHVEGPFQYVGREGATDIIARAINNEFVHLDLAELKHTLEQEPWIEKASVVRQWPDELSVTLVEQVPIARWGEAGFLNQRGQVIGVSDNQSLQALPWLHGRDNDSEKIMKQYQEMTKLLRSRHLMIEKLWVDAQGTWRLSLKDGALLVLGAEEVLSKIQRFLYVYDEYLSDSFAAVASIDLRYANGLAVGWASGYEVTIHEAG